MSYGFYDACMVATIHAPYMHSPFRIPRFAFRVSEEPGNAAWVYCNHAWRGGVSDSM